MEIRRLRVPAAAIDSFFDQPILNRIVGSGGQFFLKAFILEKFCILKLRCHTGYIFAK
jgi:hypothetical protein